MRHIAVHGVPRSGTFWLGAIFDSSPEVIFRNQPLFSYAFKGYIDEDSSKERIDDFFYRISKSDDPYITLRNKIEQGMYPGFSKNLDREIIGYKEARYHYVIPNLLRKDNDIRVIGIVRNPMAVINSFIKAPKEFRADLGWNYHEEWEKAEKKNENFRENYYGYNKWKDVNRMFLSLREEYPDKFKIVVYEDLLDRKIEVVQELFDFCRIKLTDQTLRFIEDSSNTAFDDPYGVYRTGQTHDNWKSTLDEEIIKRIIRDPDFIGFQEIFGWRN